MPSEKRRARIAGLLYLIVAVCGGLSELYVRAGVKVAGDAAALKGLNVQPRTDHLPTTAEHVPASA